MLTPLAPNKRKPKYKPSADSPAVDDGPDQSSDDDDDDSSDSAAGKPAGGS
jgi:hypothetical protein